MVRKGASTASRSSRIHVLRRPFLIVRPRHHRAGRARPRSVRASWRRLGLRRELPRVDRRLDQRLELGSRGRAPAPEGACGSRDRSRSICRYDRLRASAAGDAAICDEAIAVGAKRRQRRTGRLPQAGEHLRRAARVTARERQQQIALRAEALDQRPGGDAGLRGDRRQRQLARAEPGHRPVGRGKHVVVADLPRSCIWALGIIVSFVPFLLRVPRVLRGVVDS